MGIIFKTGKAPCLTNFYRRWSFAGADQGPGRRVQPDAKLTSRRSLKKLKSQFFIVRYRQVFSFTPIKTISAVKRSPRHSTM